MCSTPPSPPGAPRSLRPEPPLTRREALRKAAGILPAAFLLSGARFSPARTAAPHRRTAAPDQTTARPTPNIQRPPFGEAGRTGRASHMLAPLSSEQLNQAWWDEAQCRDGEASLSGVFFSEELQDIARAKSICAGCPVMNECLEGAIVRREPWGVWGGQLFLNGQDPGDQAASGPPAQEPPSRGLPARDPDPGAPAVPGPVAHRLIAPDQADAATLLPRRPPAAPWPGRRWGEAHLPRSTPGRPSPGAARRRGLTTVDPYTSRRDHRRHRPRAAGHAAGREDEAVAFYEGAARAHQRAQAPAPGRAGRLLVRGPPA